MILRLDPRIPLVWRSPTSLQFGIDPPLVRLDAVTSTQERMLAALTIGVSAPGLALIDDGAEKDSLLEILGPALVRPQPPRSRRIAVSGSEPLAGAIAGLLSATGLQVLAATDAAELAETAPELAVLVGDFVLSPELHALWLRRDVPHLAVVLSESAVEIGPMIEPGSGPCLLCLELHRRDEDAAWPTIATQLLGRRSELDSAVLTAETATIVARLVTDRLDGESGAAESVRIDAATGHRRYRPWQPHPDCGCRGLSELVSPGRRGNDWASAARSAPAAVPTTS